MIDNWQSHRIKVLNSQLLSDVLSTIELFHLEKIEEYYIVKIIGKEDKTREAKPLSQYRIAEKLEKKYPSIIRALSKLEKMDLITKVKKNPRANTFSWTHKAVVLFPEFAPFKPLSGTYNTLFGDWKECINHFSDMVSCNKDEAEAILTFLCWISRRFLGWVRDEIIFSLNQKGEDFPVVENHKYWRNLAIKYLIKEYILFISEDSKKYFSEAFENISKEDLMSLNLFFNGLRKTLKSGEKMLSIKYLDNLKYIS